MKYTWYELERLTPEVLTNLLGVKVLSVNVGDTPYGEEINSTDPEGNPITIYNHRKGVVIVTSVDLTNEQLKILDAFFVGMQRFGSLSVVTEVESLKKQVEAHEANIAAINTKLATK